MILDEHENEVAPKKQCKLKLKTKMLMLQWKLGCIQICYRNRFIKTHNLNMFAQVHCGHRYNVTRTANYEKLTIKYK